MDSASGDGHLHLRCLQGCSSRACWTSFLARMRHPTEGLHRSSPGPGWTQPCAGPLPPCCTSLLLSCLLPQRALSSCIIAQDVLTHHCWKDDARVHAALHVQTFSFGTHLADCQS